MSYNGRLALRPARRLRRDGRARRAGRRARGRGRRPRGARPGRPGRRTPGARGGRAPRRHACDGPRATPRRAARHILPGVRIALAQINATVGDIAGNEAEDRRPPRRGAEAGAELVLFPELAVTGYPPEDLLLKEHFLADARAAVDRIAGQTAGHRRRRRLPRARRGRLQRRGRLRRRRGRRRSTARSTCPTTASSTRSATSSAGPAARSSRSTACRSA